MKFPKLPNTCFRNDRIIDRLLRFFTNNSFIGLNLIFHTVSKKIINIFDQFLLIPPFLKREFGRTPPESRNVIVCKIEQVTIC